MNDPLIVTLTTVALIALSAFFVIIEFALLGARRHRLEELAVTRRSARAALRGMNDLTLMLAGAQLGITACTFALSLFVVTFLHLVVGEMRPNRGPSRTRKGPPWPSAQSRAPISGRCARCWAG